MQKNYTNNETVTLADMRQLVALFNDGQHAVLEIKAQSVLEKDPNCGFAWKILGASLQMQGKDGLHAMKMAANLLPDDADAHSNLGITLRNRGQLDDAVASCRRALQIDPNCAQAHNNLGISLQDLGQLEDAVASYRSALQLRPENAEAHSNLGNALRNLDRYTEAVTHYQWALTMRPQFAEAHNNLGNALRDLARLDEAVESSRRALQIRPDYAEAYNNLGNALLGIGRPEDAQANLQMALAIEPNFIKAHSNLGNALRDLGRLDEAATCFQRALEINPGIPEAHSNLGNAIKDLGRFDDARDCYLRALAISPDYAEAHFNLGFSLENLGRLDDAVASYRQAIALNANFSDAHNNLGNVLKGQGHLDAALASFRRAFEIEPNFSMARSNALFALHYLPNQSKETILAEARRFGEYFEALCKPSWPRHTNDRTSDRCLKIGYVSGDFREHAVAYFIEPVLANHDKSQMEIFCYSNSSRTDAFTDRLMAEADHWQSCVIMSDDQLARRIRADGIDILVDLAGHSGCNRLLTFARKPAPIQITYLGYPGTSGLSAMDYRLTDRYTEPEDSDADQFYTEKLLHLPDSMWCYRPAEGMPEVSPLPALTNGYLTFGSFNDVNKVDADCVALWAKLLNSLPASRLLMATVPEGEMRNRLIWQFSEHGVAAGRIAFCGKLPPNQFRQMLQQVDITLDPVRVNGATTTCESLWLGVPVLTLVGERFLSRVGLSILSAAQLPDFAAATVEVYIRTATFLANNLKLFAEIRTGLREHLRTTPLLDQQRFARNVESVYREIWQHWCTDEI